MSELIARPSNPSVKLTALLQATRINIAQGKKNHPISGCSDFKKGKVIVVLTPDVTIQAKATIHATSHCKPNFRLAEIPFWYLILYQSSQKPITPNPIRQARKIQT